jgi:hypothetical protein
MLKVKSVESSAKKFVTRGTAAVNDYTNGIKDTNNQAENAIAAKGAYEQGITDSIARGAREAGLAKAGTAKWKSKALALGSARYAPGITNAKDDYVKGVKPYLDTLESLELSPRGPKGSPENLNRVAEVTTALRNKKITG